ncbi:MAG: ATP phosphoribosyltransferase [Defluviitaleaceae bacterium]|nr:ATP phosphoribosyltransferase [Defluviitaleaceae bacterium]
MRKIIIALPKGSRLLPQAYNVFKTAGYPSAALEAEMEKKQWKQLEFDADNAPLTFLLVRIADIPQYVDRNWADMGISAFDCYREYELSSISQNNSMRGDNFISDVFGDLKLCGGSRFCVAGFPQKLDFYNQCKNDPQKILTVATQHPNIAANYFAGQNILADVVTVTGSTEIMPKHGGVDAIFDIVETGLALKESGLVLYEEALPIQTKILVSRAALKYDPNMAALLKTLPL